VTLGVVDGRGLRSSAVGVAMGVPTEGVEDGAGGVGLEGAAVALGVEGGREALGRGVLGGEALPTGVVAAGVDVGRMVQACVGRGGTGVSVARGWAGVQVAGGVRGTVCPPGRAQEPLHEAGRASEPAHISTARAPTSRCVVLRLFGGMLWIGCR
jgi:hypothetical protein